MGLLKDSGVDSVYHFTPLHYVPFLGRSKSLLSKPSLEKAGFSSKHLRSMSAHHDVERGFGRYAHLTLDPSPRILKAKLSAGFPHVGISVSVDALDDKVEFSLCRFNVAMTRYLRRDGKSGFPESAINGRYYDGHQIPIARTAEDKASMLKQFVGTPTMIEVLIHGDFPLPDDSRILCYSEQDAKASEAIFKQLGLAWKIESKNSPGSYPDDIGYRSAVEEFIQTALADPNWRGNGLEFDRV